MNILNSYRHIRPKKVKYPIPEIPDDSGKKSGTDWVLPKIIGSGRVSGTRQALLIQSNLFHHHGLRAELSQRTFDFSTHDHHNQASRILTEVLSIWVQVKWIPVFVISFMKNKLVYLYDDDSDCELSLWRQW